MVGMSIIANSRAGSRFTVNYDLNCCLFATHNYTKTCSFCLFMKREWVFKIIPFAFHRKKECQMLKICDLWNNFPLGVNYPFKWISPPQAPQIIIITTENNSWLTHRNPLPCIKHYIGNMLSISWVTNRYNSISITQMNKRELSWYQKVHGGRFEDFLPLTVLVKVTYKPWVSIPSTNRLLFMRL